MFAIFSFFNTELDWIATYLKKVISLSLSLYIYIYIYIYIYHFNPMCETNQRKKMCLSSVFVKKFLTLNLSASFVGTVADEIALSEPLIVSVTKPGL